MRWMSSDTSRTVSRLVERVRLTLVPHQAAHGHGQGDILGSDQSFGCAAHPVDRIDHPTRRRDASSVTGIQNWMRDVSVYLHSWFALHDDTVYAGMTVGWELPVGRCGGGQPRNVLDGDHRFGVTDALGGNPNRVHLSRLRRHHCAVNTLRRKPAFGALAHFVEFDVEMVRQTAHLTAPYRHNNPG